MDSFKLEDLVPAQASFKLSLVDKEFTLRPWTVADGLWIKNHFGDQIDKILNELRMKEICQIVFHQIEDQSFFIKRDVKVINDDGDEFTYKLGGSELLTTLVSGVSEQLEMLKALMTSIGVSRPLMEKIEGDVEKKSQVMDPKPAGPISSISSAPNMDGPPSTSSEERSESWTHAFEP